MSELPKSELESNEEHFVTMSSDNMWQLYKDAETKIQITAGQTVPAEVFIKAVRQLVRACALDPVVSFSESVNQELVKLGQKESSSLENNILRLEQSDECESLEVTSLPLSA